MPVLKPQVRNFLRRLNRLGEELVEYVALNIGGRNIQRITDFNSCKRPVLMIYGFGGTRRIFTVLEKRLRKDGYCVFSIHLGGLFDTFNTGGIIESAKLIERKIEKLTKLYHLGPISIIGHSKGGLIGSYLAKFLPSSAKICNVISLGTPYNGSPWAWLGVLTPVVLLSRSVREMWPNSPFIRQLNAKPMPPHVHQVSIYSRADSVCPYPYCKLEGHPEPHVKNIEVDNITHTQFVISRTVYEEIRRELEYGIEQAKSRPHDMPLSASQDAETITEPVAGSKWVPA